MLRACNPVSQAVELPVRGNICTLKRKRSRFSFFSNLFPLFGALNRPSRPPHHARCMPAKRIRQLANACNGAPPLFLERFSDLKEIKFYHPSKTGTRQNAAKSIRHGIQGIVLKQETAATVNDAAGK